MKTNENLITPDKSLRNQSAKLVIDYAAGVENRETKFFDVSSSMIIENGEQMIGYQYLHGTNEEVGGFRIVGIIKKDEKGNATISFTYQWNDIIDPNHKYPSDTIKSKLARLIPGSTLNDYVLRICWSDVSSLDSTGKFSSGWLQTSAYG